MLNELSWGDYIAAVVVLLTIYYLAVAILYYRNEIRDLLSPKHRQYGSGDPAPVIGEDSFEDLEQASKEINSILEKAGKGASKPTLLAELKQALAHYGGLRIPAYRAAVVNHIIHQAQELCGVGISGQELEG